MGVSVERTSAFVPQAMTFRPETTMWVLLPLESARMPYEPAPVAAAVTLRRFSVNVDVPPLPHESSRAIPPGAELTQSRSRATPLMPAVQAIAPLLCTCTRSMTTPDENALRP